MAAVTFSRDDRLLRYCRVPRLVKSGCEACCVTDSSRFGGGRVDLNAAGPFKLRSANRAFDAPMGFACALEPGQVGAFRPI